MSAGPFPTVAPEATAYSIIQNRSRKNCEIMSWQSLLGALHAVVTSGTHAIYH